jgi:eukaryotic-like serine/threonine-protein kinase
MTWLSDDVATRLQNVAARPDFSGTRYEIVEEIARGGIGIVYEAIDHELNRRVAIKVVPAGNRGEAQRIAGLEHPGIIPIHDAGTLVDGRAFYVMKLVRGTTLQKTSPRTIAEAIRLCIRICEPVAFAHAHGAAHRDLKPSNVMIGEFGEVLVMDWGVGVAGTPGYMAPEQRPGPAADVFALGTMLKEIVATTGEAIPRRLRAVIAKATSSEPDARYPSARELAGDLVRFFDDQPVAAYPETAVDRVLRWMNRNRALIAIIAAYLVMRVIVLLFAHR